MMSVSCVVPIYGLSNDNMILFENLLNSLSVAAKCLKNNFELIVVNDDVANIQESIIISMCEKYGFASHLKYLSNNENKGQAFSRNKGAMHAAHDYLHFIDQDDYISPNFYSEVSNSKDRKDLYIAKPYFYNQKSKDTVKACSWFLERLYSRSVNVSELWPLLLVNVAYSPGQVLIRKIIFNSCGGFKVLKNKGSDDYALFYNMVSRGSGYVMSYIPTAKFYYSNSPLFF